MSKRNLKCHGVMLRGIHSASIVFTLLQNIIKKKEIKKEGILNKRYPRRQFKRHLPTLNLTTKHNDMV